MKTFNLEELGTYCSDACANGTVEVVVSTYGTDMQDQNFDFQIDGSEEYECLADMVTAMGQYGYTAFQFMVKNYASVTLDIKEVYAMFKKIDADCMRDGADAIPFTDTEYYAEQISAIYDRNEEESLELASALLEHSKTLSQDEGTLIQGDVTMERKFERALNIVLQEMQVVDDNLCCAVYWDDMCMDNAIVMFMEYGGYKTMHAVMKDLHARLSNRMGHPVSICHNSPTDENVLIHGGAEDASVYYSDECCKRSTIRCCQDILDNDNKGYREEIRSIAFAAEVLAEGLNKTAEYVLQTLDWDKDIQAQLIFHLINYHR